MERCRTGRRRSAAPVRNREIPREAPGADGTLEPQRGGIGFFCGSGSRSEPGPLVRPVDRQPLAVLGGLALAGRKRREPLASRGDVVALAVGAHLGANLLFGVCRSSHGRSVPESIRFVNLLL